MAAPELADQNQGGERPTREIAQRLFAAEYNQSNLEVKEGGERSPSYVITPLGAKVNRLFVVGVLTSNENIGAAGDMWRAQITDPTGVFNVYAGQYQPEATAALAEIRPPAIVAVVGKSRTYSPEPGVTYTSIRPEIVKVVDVSERDRWVLETAKHMKQRLECLRELQAMATPSADKLVELGYPRALAESAVKAVQHYGKVDLQEHVRKLRDALE
ncbi:MAG TPA: hypothetical protein VNZ52_13565, partial [Candidatus Thermoplasmatota archaeon]|nr:hypothetical protein [Candidatus Thermoplasmatota archaeon]